MTSLDPLRGTPAWGAGEEIPDLAALLPPRFEQPALCAETDPEVFFPDKGGETGAAKSVCRRCKAREECLAWAIEHDEHGVWGGTSRIQRLRIQRRRSAA